MFGDWALPFVIALIAAGLTKLFEWMGPDTPKAAKELVVGAAAVVGAVVYSLFTTGGLPASPGAWWELLGLIYLNISLIRSLLLEKIGPLVIRSLTRDSRAERRNQHLESLD